MEIDDGCCELLVTGPGGNTLEAKPDPGTFDVVDARVEKFRR